MFLPMLNTNVTVPDPFFDALFELEVRKSVTGSAPMSQEEVFQFLESKIDGFNRADFKPEYLLQA